MDKEYYGLNLIQTCWACPEQYDVYHGNREVGYIRLRHGGLWCDGPDGEPLLRCEVPDSDGIFSTREQRDEYLEKCARLIKDKIKCI